MASTMWQLQDAKAHFSELVRTALDHGPQFVSRHGQEAVVVISAREYHQLTDPKTSLLEFFRSAPTVELDITRSKDPSRDISL